MANTQTQNYNLVPYKIDSTKTIEVAQIKDDVWLTQKQMAQLFECSKMNISLHLKNIFKSGELDKKMTVKEFFTTTQHGAIEGKTQTTTANYYNLDAIISVGYRVNSKRGVMFRQWATQIIKERIRQEYSNPKPKNLKNNGAERAILINDLLRRKGMTQQQVAKDLGYSYVTICNCIRGKHFNLVIENWIEAFLEECDEEKNNLFKKSKKLLKNALNGDITALEKLKTLLNSVECLYDAENIENLGV